MPLFALVPKVSLQFGGFIGKQRAYNFCWALASGKHDMARQVQGWIFRVGASLVLQIFFSLAENHFADPCPINRSRAHGAGFRRGIERAMGQKIGAISSGGA